MNPHSSVLFAAMALGLPAILFPRSVTASGGVRTVALTGREAEGLELDGMGPFSRPFLSVISMIVAGR